MINLLPTDLVHFLSIHGYWAAFLAMTFAGPLGDVVAGFFVSAKILNFFIIWVLSVAADLTSDIFYYEIGRHGGLRLFNKLGRFFSWPQTLLEKVDHIFAKHGKKALVIIKFTHGIGALTQFSAGMSKMPRRTYISLNIAAGAVQSLIWLGIGIFAGDAWQAWLHKAKNATIGLSIIVGAVVVVYGIIWLIQRYLENRIER